MKEGAKLQQLQQKSSYKILIEKRSEKEPIDHERELGEAREIALENGGGVRSYEQLRIGLWKGPFSNKISDFIWKIRNGRVKCGTYFKRMQGWEDKATCECGQMETINHILFECPKNYAKDAWAKMREVWEEAHPEKVLNVINIKTIKGLPEIRIRGEKGEEKEATKLAKTIIAETMWMIWCCRNRRIFDKVELSKIEVVEKTISQIEARAHLEFAIVKKSSKWYKDKEECLRRWGGITKETNGEPKLIWTQRT